MSTTARTGADVVVVGDGPAGSAIAQALHQRGIDVMLVGPDEPWHATYGTWADDVERATVLGGADIWLHRMDSIAVRFNQRRIIERAYGVVDNRRLRAVLRSGVEHHRAAPAMAEVPSARLTIDATGWPSTLASDGAQRSTGTARDSVAWQTAYGVVLATAPSGPLGSPMMMDFSDPPGPRDALRIPTFAYALPVEDGWLVEETVLAATPAIDPTLLAVRLARRLDMSTSELAECSVRVEQVRIPMGAKARRPEPGTTAIPYGAAGGMIHPATGYSIAAALGAARPAADRIAEALAAHRTDSSLRADHDRLDRIVWSDESMRTRLLHEYGLTVLQRMDAAGVRSFFDTFFDSEPDLWAAFLRIDTPPRLVAKLMASMFRRADWSLRRQLVRSDLVPMLYAMAKSA
jgi:lycopene beta-cyclase